MSFEVNNQSSRTRTQSQWRGSCGDLQMTPAEEPDSGRTKFD